MANTANKYPRGLRTTGTSLWDSVIDQYTLDPAEKVVLTQICRTVDDLDRIDADLREMGVTVAGSTGQPVANPLLRERREMVKVIDQLCRSLALPVPGEEVGKRRSPDAKANAKAPGRRPVRGRLAHVHRIETNSNPQGKGG